MLLKDRVAIVTGGSSGIGRGVCLEFAREGAKVVVADVQEEPKRGKYHEQDIRTTTVDEIEKLGSQGFFVQADMADEEDVKNLVQSAVEHFGGLDILVNNAGRTRDGLAMRMSDEDWNGILEVNLSAGFRLSRAVLRGMMKRRFGRIINITSIVGQVGNPGQANYVAAKAGLAGMTKSLAGEVASRNITVNCIAPGFIETPMTDALPEDRRAALLTSIPAGRLGQPDDIAAGAVYLASDEAAYVTGATLSINGGMAMI